MEQLEKAGFAQSQRVSNLVDKARPWFLGSLMFPVTETQLLIVINHTNSLQNGIRRSLQGLQRTRPDPRMHTLIISIAHQDFVCTQSSIFSRCAKSDANRNTLQRALRTFAQASCASRGAATAGLPPLPRRRPSRGQPHAQLPKPRPDLPRAPQHARTRAPTQRPGTKRRGPERPGPARQVRFDTLQEHLDFRPGCGRVPRPGPARPVRQ